MLGDELKNAEPLKDFDVPSERILTGRLNNSQYLNHLDSQLGYLLDTQRGRSGEVAQVPFISFLRYA